MTWVLATENILKVEENLGRKAVDGQRKKPNGSILQWKQLGVLDILEDSQQPFYIQWINGEHPSSDGTPNARLLNIIINGEPNTNLDLSSIININSNNDSAIKFLNDKTQKFGIEKVHFNFNNTVVTIY